MHELSLIEELMVQCSVRARGRTVVEVWARCPASIDTDELLEGFTFLAPQVDRVGGGTSLSQAELKLETVPVHFECGCGFAGELGPDNYAGHFGICPHCDAVGELAAGLELVDIKYALMPPRSAPPGGLSGPSWISGRDATSGHVAR